MITGRFFFHKLNSYTIVKLDIPPYYHYGGHASSYRQDLPIRDFYSYIAGIFILFVFWIPIKYIVNYMWRTKLVRKPSIRRGRGRNFRGFGGLVGAIPDAAENEYLNVSLRISTWWQRKGRYQTITFLKGLYFLLFVGILIPLSFGMALDIYLLTPLAQQPSVTHIIYVVQDWALGAISLRFLYTIVQLLPDNAISALITQSIQQGVARCDLYLLSTKVIFPMLSSFVVALCLPILVNIGEEIFGIRVNNSRNRVRRS